MAETFALAVHRKLYMTIQAAIRLLQVNLQVYQHHHANL